MQDIEEQLRTHLADRVRDAVVPPSIIAAAIEADLRHRRHVQYGAVVSAALTTALVVGGVALNSGRDGGTARVTTSGGSPSPTQTTTSEPTPVSTGPKAFALPKLSFHLPAGYEITHTEVDSPPLPGGGVHKERTYYIDNGNLAAFIHVAVRVGDDAQEPLTPRTFRRDVPRARWTRIGGVRVVDTNPGGPDPEYEWTIEPGIVCMVSGSPGTSQAALADIIRTLAINDGQ